jgi:lysophospholipase L1-like esterase
MNSNKKVVALVVSSFLLLLLASIIAESFHFNWLPLNRVSLITDIIKNKSDAEQLKNTEAVEVVPIVAQKNFQLYQQAHTITGFYDDSTAVALPNLMTKLLAQDTGNKKKIRIAYFGDSMIEGDLITKTIRELLQKRFGGSGVGFIPVTSQASKFRTTVAANYSTGWQDNNFKNSGKHNQLFLSGHSFKNAGQWLTVTDLSNKDSVNSTEKYILIGKGAANSFIVNGYTYPYATPNAFNQLLVANDKNKFIKLQSLSDTTAFYGISFESSTGIIVDNFSFRGISGVEFGTIDTNFLSAIAKTRTYDLIVFQFGVNLLFRPNDLNFNWYAKLAKPVLKKFKQAFPTTDLLLTSTADRAFRYNDTYATAIGIDSLIKTQAALAYEEGWSFYNLYATMGGKNTIVKWADQNPSLANKDYVHPNQKGAEVLGHLFVETILSDYSKFKRQQLIAK